MSRSIKLDEDNNILYNHRGFFFVEDEEALAQDIRNKLRMYKGEYFINPELGIDYHKATDKYNQDIIIDNIKKAVNDDPRVAYSTVKLVHDEVGKLNLSIEIITTEGIIVNV